jgi:hypothetical protein
MTDTAIRQIGFNAQYLTAQQTYITCDNSNWEPVGGAVNFITSGDGFNIAITSPMDDVPYTGDQLRKLEALSRGTPDPVCEEDDDL